MESAHLRLGVGLVATTQESALTLESVYRQHAVTVLRWAARLGGGRVDPEDVAHDVFLTVERDLQNFRGDSALTTWLYSITLNAVRSRWRRERFRRFFHVGADEGLQQQDRGPLAPDRLEARDSVKLVNQALERLSWKYRQVLVLFELEGRAGKEVADLMGCEVSKIWVWLHRAREQFAREVSALSAVDGER